MTCVSLGLSPFTTSLPFDRRRVEGETPTRRNPERLPFQREKRRNVFEDKSIKKIKEKGNVRQHVCRE